MVGNGSGPAGALGAVSELAALPGWWGLPAVKAGHVYIVDAPLLLRAGPRIVRALVDPCIAYRAQMLCMHHISAASMSYQRPSQDALKSRGHHSASMYSHPLRIPCLPSLSDRQTFSRERKQQLSQSLFRDMLVSGLLITVVPH